jgi:hypothetical protein
LVCACIILACRQDRAFNLQFLKDEFDLGPDHVEALYQYAKFQFDCGIYSSASELLTVRLRLKRSSRQRGSSSTDSGGVAAAMQ